MRKRLTARTTISIVLLTFAGEMAWSVENQYFNVFMYNEIAANPTYISWMVAMSAITATLTAVFLGALSDKIGKRKVFFVIGLPLWAITTAIFPLAGLLKPVLLAVSIAILFDCVMTFFGSMSNDAALKAYSTDVTTLDNRGKINAAMEVALLVAVLVVYGGSGLIIEKLGYYALFYIIGGVVGVLGTLGAFLAKDPEIQPSEKSYWQNLKSTFSLTELKQNKNALLVFIGVMIRGIAFNIFFPYIIIYLQYHLEFSITQSSMIIFISLLVAILAAIPVGYLIDKIGRKLIAFISIGLEAVALILFAIPKGNENFILLAIIGVFMMIAMMLWDVAVLTWTKDLYPEEKRGQFAGLFMIFFVLIPMTIGPFIGGIIAKTTGETFPDPLTGQLGFIPPPLLFIIAGILMIPAVIPLIWAKDLKKDKRKPEEII
ncbi:MAG: MFS transporter [Candidatus Heimdallarchaeota archaeon]|nr:MFS transporter [Candidatus Heimdallarchaeota archaeon]MCG3255490.1 MFS transporter [Candidatus Heimdallarchaeota archaeon]MCK4610564.1 MFS transporter [Candidatus Heimdallarchaeota archaeon]